MEPQCKEIDGQRFAKVRVPIMIDADGRWTASGDSEWDRNQGETSLAHLADSLGFDHVRRIHFLYALVPIPDAQDYSVIGADCDNS